MLGFLRGCREGRADVGKDQIIDGVVLRGFFEQPTGRLEHFYVKRVANELSIDICNRMTGGQSF